MKIPEGEKLCGGNPCSAPHYSIVGRLVPSDSVPSTDVDISKYDTAIDEMQDNLAASKKTLAKLQQQISAQKMVDTDNAENLKREISRLQNKNDRLEDRIRNAKLTKGPKGNKGAPGEPGPQGPKGAAGRPGLPGPDGDEGPVGRNGKPGPNGLPGAAGKPGAPGKTGREGPEGPRGRPGDAGPPGVRGKPGPVGKVGEMGPIGSIGPDGLRGATGPTGPDGEEGVVGKTGKTGPVGPEGVRGPKGPTGETGRTGARGVSGPTGFKGKQGPKGQRGERGFPGPRGPPGDVGPRGLQGRDGPKGSRGRSGAPGPRGQAGPTGFAGTNGVAGQPGRNGANGADGKLGPRGPRGLRGAIGLEGPQGAPGDDGRPGPRGDPGRQGLTGPMGPKGARGKQGFPGARGPPGDLKIKTVVKRGVSKETKALIQKLKKKIKREKKQLKKAKKQEKKLAGCPACPSAARGTGKGKIVAKVVAVKPPVLKKGAIKESRPIVFKRSATKIALTGLVINFVNNLPVKDVKITVKKKDSGEVVSEQKTNNIGKWGLMIEPGNYIVSGTKSGFVGVPATMELATGARTESLVTGVNPVLPTGAVRFVVTWGDHPKDLDSWLIFPNNKCKIIYYNRVCKNWGTANLDLDATNGNGPETITMTSGKEGTYQYQVNQYTNDGTLANSEGKVMVFTGDSVRIFRAAKAAAGDKSNGIIQGKVWKVLKWVVDKNGKGKVQTYE